MAAGELTKASEMSKKRLRFMPGKLVSFSVPWPETSLIDFLEHGSNQPRVYWESDRHAVGFAGYGVACEISSQGSKRFQEIHTQVNELFANIYSNGDRYPKEVGPRMFGGFAFETESSRSRMWRSFQDSYFILPKFLLTRLGDDAWLTVSRVLEPGQDFKDGIRMVRDLAEELSWEGVPSEYLSPMVDTRVKTGDLYDRFAYQEGTSQDCWFQQVQEIRRQIQSGDLDKVVLARTLEVAFDQTLHLADVMARLGARYPDCYRFLFEPTPGQAFFGATPELLIELEGNKIFSEALAGSIKRGNSWQEDIELGQQLLNNPKDRHEHALVVQAIETALRPLTNWLEIPDEPALSRLNNIQHLRTPFQGKIREGLGILSLVEALHPTPALGGHPQRKALRLISELEPQSRGWYGGPIGWIGPDNDGVFAVAIRSAVCDSGGVLLYAGGGIVSDSVPDMEWKETELKFQPLLHALGINHSSFLDKGKAS